jgi:hypothetical protein
MKTRFVLLVTCMLACVAQAQAQDSKVQMWTWKDANGTVHYSDVPGPGAVKMDVNVSQGQPGAAPAAPAPGPSRPAAPAATSYNSLSIVQPADGTSYFDADTVVDVQIASDPELASGDSVFLYLDGKRVGNSGDALSYSLPSVERGAHSLTAAIFDAQGNEKIRSRQVVFYMKQTTVGTPAAMGPAVKPKPRPRPTPQGGG